jgi:hypothetical protein
VAAALAKHPLTKSLATCAMNGLPVGEIARAPLAEQAVWFAISDEITRRRNTQT